MSPLVFLLVLSAALPQLEAAHRPTHHARHEVSHHHSTIAAEVSHSHHHGHSAIAAEARAQLKRQHSRRHSHVEAAVHRHGEHRHAHRHAAHHHDHAEHRRAARRHAHKRTPIVVPRARTAHRANSSAPLMIWRSHRVKAFLKEASGTCDWFAALLQRSGAASAWSWFKRNLRLAASTVASWISGALTGIAPFLSSALGLIAGTVAALAGVAPAIAANIGTSVQANVQMAVEAAANVAASFVIVNDKDATAADPKKGALVTATEAKWDTTEARRAMYGPKIAAYGVSIGKLAGATLNAVGTTAFSYTLTGLDTLSSFCSLMTDFRKAYGTTYKPTAQGDAAQRLALCKFKRRSFDIAVGLVLTGLSIAITCGTMGAGAALAVPIASMVWGLYKVARDEAAILDPCQSAEDAVAAAALATEPVAAIGAAAAAAAGATAAEQSAAVAVDSVARPAATERTSMVGRLNP